MDQNIAALLVTICAEFIILWLFFRIEPLKIFFYAVLINCFTLPIATYVFQNVFSGFLIIEAGIILVEAVLIAALFKIKFTRAFLYSFIANAITAIIGLTMFPIPPGIT